MKVKSEFKVPQYSHTKASPHKPHLDGIRILLSAMVVSMADDVMGQTHKDIIKYVNKKSQKATRELGRSDLKNFRNWDIFLLAKDSNCFDIPSAETINKWLENPKPFVRQHTSEEYKKYQRNIYNTRTRERT